MNSSPDEDELPRDGNSYELYFQSKPRAPFNDEETDIFNDDDNEQTE